MNSEYNLFDSFYYSSRYKNNILKGKKPFQNLFWKRYIKRFKDRGKLLEVGFGLGYFLRYIENVYETYGIEISYYGAKISKEKSKHSMVCISDAQRICFKQCIFDFVICFDTFEHLQNPQSGIEECLRVLKEGGILIFSVPNMSSIGRKWKGQNWYAFRDNTHISLLEKENWLETLEKASFQLNDLFYDGLWDSPYFKYIPKFLQHIIFKIPATFLFSFGVRFPERYGETLYMVCQKMERGNYD